ncbi:MAG: hypothetical protein RUDDFDWM_001960 [Candidatus Fervidibacterota bacterium]
MKHNCNTAIKLPRSSILKPFILFLFLAVVPLGCSKERGRAWSEGDLVGRWQLVDRGAVGTPPLGELCEFRADGTVVVFEGSQTHFGTYRVERGEVELLIAGRPTERWIISSDVGKELSLFSRSLNTTVRYVKVSPGGLLTGTIGIILKSAIVIALLFLLYRFLARVLEFD